MKKNRNIDLIADSLENSARTKIKAWEFISDLFCVPLGWSFLFLKYRDKNKMTATKIKQYDGSFGVVGRTILIQFLLLLLVLLILVIIIALVTGNIKAN